MQVNVDKVKAQLSYLLDKVMAGEEIIIAKGGKPIARLTPVAPRNGKRSGVKLGGLKKARLKLALDFHAPTADDDLLAP